MKLLKTRLYYYVLPDRIKKQVSSYLCETLEEVTKDDMIMFQDSNKDFFSIRKENLNMTAFLGAVDASYAIVFELVGENTNIEEAEKTICADSAVLFESLIEASKRE